MPKPARSKGWTRELVEFALNKDVDQEIRHQREILAESPRSARAHFDMGVLHYSQGRSQEAVSEFLEAIDCDPSYARAYRKLGEIFVVRGEYDRAAWYAQTAAERGDRTLLEAFERYPNANSLLENTHCDM
jgi:lipopolysaccharide biosynthesis regulator YciM